jgi:hypothetical protein
MKRILLILPFLAACATSPEYTSYLQAQQEANKQAIEHQKPLVRLTAHPGQTITGLQSLEVYTPTAAPVFQQSRPNEWAAVVQTGLGVVGTLGGIKLGGDAAIGLAGEMRKGASYGYDYMQNPLTQPAPLVVTQPAPTIVTQPAPTIVTAPSAQVVNPVVVQPVVVGVPQ